MQGVNLRIREVALAVQRVEFAMGAAAKSALEPKT